MENKFILQIVFSDDSSIHYVLDRRYLPAGTIFLDEFKERLRSIPEVHLSDELFSQIRKFHYWSISNNIDIF